MEAQHGVVVVMADGVLLRAVRYFAAQSTRDPIIVIRSPYGRLGYRGGVYRFLFDLVASCLRNAATRSSTRAFAAAPAPAVQWTCDRKRPTEDLTVDWIASQTSFGADNSGHTSLAAETVRRRRHGDRVGLRRPPGGRPAEKSEGEHRAGDLVGHGVPQGGAHVVEDEQTRGGDRGGERLTVADREERIRAAMHDECR